jgi:hypothetical protein
MQWKASTFIPQGELPKEQKLERIWGLYKHYCAQVGEKEIAIRRGYYKNDNLQLHGFYDSAWGTCSNNIQNFETSEPHRNYPKILNKLDINLSWPDIENIFNREGVIQLKEIEADSHTLLLGCGNNPPSEFYELREHFHKSMTTINPDLFMNPTVVAAFGIDNLSNVLPPKQYDTLAFEYFGNIYKTEAFLKAVEAPYFRSPLTQYHWVEQRPPLEFRGPVKRDKDGYDVIVPFDPENIFDKGEDNLGSDGTP